jgi:hypothetical protein
MTAPTRERLLTEAMRLFSEQSKGTRVAQIRGAAGVVSGQARSITTSSPKRLCQKSASLSGRRCWPAIQSL